MSKLHQEIESAINRSSAENGSNTPDFILAQFLIGCLAAYDQAVTAREFQRASVLASLPSPSALREYKLRRALNLADAALAELGACKTTACRRVIAESLK